MKRVPSPNPPAVSSVRMASMTSGDRSMATGRMEMLGIELLEHGCNRLQRGFRIGSAEAEPGRCRSGPQVQEAPRTLCVGLLLLAWLGLRLLARSPRSQ